jgi:putative aminopeptidase FrvX
MSRKRIGTRSISWSGLCQPDLPDYRIAKSSKQQIHLHRSGVPTVVIGVPARHIHSHSAILHRDDYDRALRLISAVIGKLDEKTVRGLAA